VKWRWYGHNGCRLLVFIDYHVRVSVTVSGFVRVRVLGVTLLDLGLDKHVFFRHPCSMFLLASLTLVSSTITWWRIREDACPRLCHSPGGNIVLAGTPRSVTDRLQQVLNAAVRLVSGTRKYDRGLSQLLHADLHWLNVADRVWYKLAVTVHRCLHNKAQSTWQSVVLLSRISLVVSDCAQHTIASWIYCAIDEQHSAVRRSLSLDQPSGIRLQMSSEKRLKTLTGCHWKRRF